MEAAPLLYPASRLPSPVVIQDHPAFLRACHSPWRCIPQNVLLILRGFILAVLATTGIISTHYNMIKESEYTKWRFPFDFGVVSFALTLLYHSIAFSWTFTHLYYPHPEDNEGGSIEGLIVRGMSLPSNMGSLRKQFRFTMFYTTACVFEFMNSTIYWFVTRQQQGGAAHPKYGELSTGESTTACLSSAMASPIPDAPFSDLFGEDWLKPFSVLSVYAIPSSVMAFEIFFLNSIKNPLAIGSHVLGLIASSGLYLGWAAIGKAFTDWDAFNWLNPDNVGSNEAVAVYCIGFVLLSQIMFILMQGFVGVRNAITRSLSQSRAAAAAQESLEEE